MKFLNVGNVLKVFIVKYILNVLFDIREFRKELFCKFVGLEVFFFNYSCCFFVEISENQFFCRFFLFLGFNLGIRLLRIISNLKFRNILY